MRRSTLSLLLLCAALLSGCSSLNSLNPFSTSAPKPAELAAFQATAELRSIWQARVGGAGGFAFQPVVVGEDVYAAGHDGSVARIEGGRSVWRTNVGQRLSAGVGSDGKLVAVVTTAVANATGCAC